MVSTPMAEITVDETRTPIVLITFPNECTVADYQQAVDRYVTIARRGRRVAWLTDLRAFNPLMAPGPVRRAATELRAPHVELLASVSAAEARVLTSNIVRGLSAAFNWLTPVPWPIAHFREMENAEAWLHTQLAKHAP